jgi:phosphonate transport system substrate-binding protein
MPTPHDPRRRRLLGTALALAGSAFVRHAAGADASKTAARPIEIGILPYMPTTALLAGHQALRIHFEETFGRQALVSTAPDFQSFQQRVVRGDFDFIIIGPGPGWQAHLDHKHQVVAVSQRMVRIYILVAKDGPIATPANLRGKTLATIDPMTVTSQTTMWLLREHKLVPGSDVRIRHEKSPFNAAQALALGEVAAAGFPNVAYPNLPPEIAAKLRILLESDGMPGVLFMVRPAPDMPGAGAFQAALFRFGETEAGRKYLKEFNHDALLKPDLRALRTLDRFVPEIRRLLATP